jgi:hypothetical protein
MAIRSSLKMKLMALALLLVGTLAGVGACSAAGFGLRSVSANSERGSSGAVAKPTPEAATIRLLIAGHRPASLALPRDVKVILPSGRGPK